MKRGRHSGGNGTSLLAAAALATAIAASAIGCSASSGDGAVAGDPQTPPTGGTAIEAWLEGGAYRGWHCEEQMHGPRSPSVHGLGRVCTNAALSTAAASGQPWPTGAAAVEELYHLATDPAPAGYAVYVKTGPDDEDSSGWYWYARVPVGSTKLSHDARGVAADGLGSDRVPHATCVGCHAAAGSDQDHTPTAGGRAPVYTPVP